MTFMLFLEIFVLSLLGVSLGPNLYFASLQYTSPTFVTSMVEYRPFNSFCHRYHPHVVAGDTPLSLEKINFDN
uniref:WAT1-related protein n=1 Tax=Saccharum officinarum TaxID=4547 RepID=A0A678T4H0_SACOF|nr:WAT1-related protein [Saccharum officinarum]